MSLVPYYGVEVSYYWDKIYIARDNRGVMDEPNRRNRGSAQEILDGGELEEENAKEFDNLAVVHGNYLARGGGEFVAEAIARTFDAPLYYGFGDPDNVPDDIESHSLANDSILSPLSGSKIVRDPLYFLKFRHLPELHQYDVVIQSGNEFGWYVPPTEQVVVRYLHSTPRTPYDRFPEKGGDTKESLYSEFARLLYQATVPYPDIYVPNSELIARRAFRYWDKNEDVSVVYPPVDVDEFYHENGGDYYFTISRIYPMKRIDEMVQAFQNLPDKRLIIAGTGSDGHECELKQMAGDNVEFRGFVSEDEKRELFANAKATLFSAEAEDFGLVPIEAMASGSPVIGIRDGFTKYQIHDGVTGVLYDRGVENLTDAIDRFEREGVDATPDDLQSMAANYSTERFAREMREVVRDAIQKAAISPETDGFLDRIWRSTSKDATDQRESTEELVPEPDGGENLGTGGGEI